MKHRKLLIIALCLIAAVYIVGIGFLKLRDERAIDRCVDSGGETWDEGAHCVFNPERTTSTRGNFWGN